MFPWLRMHIDKVNARWRVTKNIITELIPCNFPHMVVQVWDLRTHGDTYKIAIWTTETLGSDNTSPSVNLDINSWGSSKPKTQVLKTPQQASRPHLFPRLHSHTLLLQIVEVKCKMQSDQKLHNRAHSLQFYTETWKLAQILEAALNPKPWTSQQAHWAHLFPWLQIGQNEMHHEG